MPPRPTNSPTNSRDTVQYVVPTRTVRLLTVQQACARLGLGKTKVYELLEAGVLPRVRIGRAVRVPEHELDRWILDHTEYGYSERAY